MNDLFEYAVFIARDNPAAADHFLSAAHRSFERLVRFPHLGSRREFNNPIFRGVRMWPIPGFRRHLVFYKSISSGVEILRVIHASQDFWKVLEE